MNLNGKPEVGFIVACKEFFGFKPGQTLLDFKNEVGQLTPEDRIAQVVVAPLIADLRHGQSATIAQLGFVRYRVPRFVQAFRVRPPGGGVGILVEEVLQRPARFRTAAAGLVLLHDCSEQLVRDARCVGRPPSCEIVEARFC